MDDKGKFNIKEVSEITGVAPHVILYWETEFSQLNPERDELRQRIFTQRDMEIVKLIQNLLFANGFTIADTKIALTEKLK